MFGRYLHFATFIGFPSTRTSTRLPGATSSDPKVFQKSICNIPNEFLSGVKADALN
jgi:hypothetical protein